MKKLSLKKRWDQNKSVVNGWCSIPSTVTTEIMSLNNFHSLTVDLQHGLVDYQQALNMIQSMGSGEITPLARVPWNEPGIIMKFLDAGSKLKLASSFSVPVTEDEFSEIPVITFSLKFPVVDLTPTIPACTFVAGAPSKAPERTTPVSPSQ